MEKDMTAGSPAKMILNFTIPLFLGNVFQQFYSMEICSHVRDSLCHHFDSYYNHQYGWNEIPFNNNEYTARHFS